MSRLRLVTKKFVGLMALGMILTVLGPVTADLNI